MEIKNDRKTVITGRHICLVVGIMSAICGIYWIIKAIAFDDTNLPAMLGSIACALFLTLYATKRP